MKTLEFPFTKKSWTHELIKREGPVVLVRRHKQGHMAHFEVILLRERLEETFQRAGREIHMPYREVYPSSEDWGTYGFTFPSAEREKAEKKFDKLCTRRLGSAEK